MSEFDWERKFVRLLRKFGKDEDEAIMLAAIDRKEAELARLREENKDLAKCDEDHVRTIDRLRNQLGRAVVEGEPTSLLEVRAELTRLREWTALCTCGAGSKALQESEER